MLVCLSILFSDNGEENKQVTLFVPPKKLTRTEYICDKRFHLDEILEMYGSETSYGLVFITGKEYTIYKISKNVVLRKQPNSDSEKQDNINFGNIKKLCKGTVRLPKKQKKGGQSAPRFQRLRLEAIEAYIKKASEEVIDCYMSENNTEYLVNEIFIMGPSSKKTLLSESVLLRQYFSSHSHQMHLIDAEHLDEKSMKQIDEILMFDSNKCEESVLEYVKELLATADDKMVFGTKEVEAYAEELAEVICDEESIFGLKLGDKCKVRVLKKESLARVGINCIGVKWY